MAWQSSVVNSAADLVASIVDFAVAQGWALSGSVLSKGGAYIELTAPSVSEVRIRAARGGVFSGIDLCPRYPRIFITSWPSSAEVQLFAFDDPDTVWCVLRTNSTDYMHLGFGSIAKYGDWAGGQWFHAQHTGSNTDRQVCATVGGGAQPYFNTSARNCALFWSQRDRDLWSGGSTVNKCSFLHCEVRGEVWPATGPSNDASDLNVIHCPTITTPIHSNNPNVFNGQTVLSPFLLFLQNTDGHYMSVGHLGHLRFVKLTNYNPGDIVSIAGDRWRVFPWDRKDPTNPDGKAPSSGDSSASTGLLGIAISYDGP
ncbi:hypothetical protein GO613_12615 [Azoarcus communis]|uniref:hypothetical protein n=1 Tax=Parazoarcus communis TaxID=41977 RepID=UPI0014593BD0|nr:hypothetical protein [Parazoarcus communis]NMG48943.1 hypothetical protein [Parazoarcus communis]